MSSIEGMAQAMQRVMLEAKKGELIETVLKEIERQAQQEFDAHFRIIQEHVPKVLYEGVLDLDAIAHRIIDALITIL